MPSTITHNYFGKDLYGRIKPRVDVDKNLFIISNQGHDLLMFYKFWNLKKRAKAESNCSVLQNVNFRYFVKSYIEKIKDIDENLKRNAKSFIYGYIAHHILDAYVHPKVVYETGIVDIRNKETYKYRGKHALYETILDIEFIIDREKEINRKTIYETFPKRVKLDKSIEKLTDDVFRDVYGIDGLGKKFNDSLNNVYYFMKIFRYDSTGIKKWFYELVDKIITKPNSYYGFLSYKRSFEKYKNLLHSNDYWYYPYVGGKKVNYSFVELYNMALDKTEEIIDGIEKYLKNMYHIDELDLIIPDISAIHGLECSRDVKLIKFRY